MTTECMHKLHGLFNEDILKNQGFPDVEVFFSQLEFKYG